MQIRHDSQDIRFRSPSGAVTLGSKITLNLFAPGCSGASIRLWQEEKGETMIPMEGRAALFSATFTVPNEPCVLWYFFVANYGDRMVCYGNNPESLGGEGCIYENSQPPSFQITVYKKSEAPGWYKNALVYQIFPDRFARGNNYEEKKAAAALPANWNGRSRFFEEDWYSIPEYIRDAEGNVTNWQFYGGSLKGIEEKIQYLKSLGVTAIYLNPIFKASSNHRYDTADYMTVDPLLGDNKGFAAFAKKCRDNGIRLILDGVFSHTGADSVYFDKYENYGGGAYHDERSKYRSWYRFRNEGPGYDCWWGVADLPNVEELDPSYNDFICGKQGVLKHWLKLGASGFRLDVADELPDEFIKNIRSSIKETDSEGLLIGEVWEDASNKHSYGSARGFLLGDELDGTMNYPFREYAIKYILGAEDAKLFARRMLKLKENYPAEAFYSALNLLDGHDCVRILTAVGSSDMKGVDIYRNSSTDILRKPAAFLEGGDYAKAKQLLKQLTVLQFCLPGVPCVYYGDEAGVQGSLDPDNRRTYPWGRADDDLLFHYRTMGRVYASCSALKDGELFLDTCDNAVIITRKNKKETVIGIVNASDHAADISIPSGGCEYAIDLLTSNEFASGQDSFDITVPQGSYMILLLKDKAPLHIPLDRRAGVLCSLSSIPSVDPGKNDGASNYKGALGKRGRAFVDWLAESGFGIWQLLPFNPAGAGDSPYYSPCVFAGDIRYIDTDELPPGDGFDDFCEENAYWLDDWARYAASIYGEGKEDDISVAKYEQYSFFTQWKALREYANSKGILMVGDLPIYASPDSCDTMAHPEAFQLDEKGRLLYCGGVPPDYFSSEGQNWFSPLYNWDNLRAEDYEWWYQRLKFAKEYFDLVRLDHFRSFSEYFAIPEGDTPKEGTWQCGPGIDFFDRMRERLGGLNIIAEDLGILDAGVYSLLKLTGFPGMNIWQFSADEMKAMDDEAAGNRIFYSGTHDNQTLLGWCRERFPDDDAERMASESIDSLLASKAPWVIFQLQDILLLDDDSRMNVPGTTSGNWSWQLKEPLPELKIKRPD